MSRGNEEEQEHEWQEMKQEEKEEGMCQRKEELRERHLKNAINKTNLRL